MLGDAFGTAMALHQLGLAALASGDRYDALRLCREALATRHEVGDRLDLAISLDVVASLVAESDPTFAARLIGAADGLRTRHRLPVPPDSETRRDIALPLLSEHGAARAAGRVAPLDLVVDEAIDVGD
jgi:hypothetical protein